MAKSRVPEKSVHLVNYPKFVFVWPLIVAPGLLLVLEKLGCPSQVLGWIYVAMATVVIMTLGMDLDRSTAFILSLVLCSLLLVGRLLHTEYSVNIF